MLSRQFPIPCRCRREQAKAAHTTYVWCAAVLRRSLFSFSCLLLGRIEQNQITFRSRATAAQRSGDAAEWRSAFSQHNVGLCVIYGAIVCAKRHGAFRGSLLESVPVY